MKSASPITSSEPTLVALVIIGGSLPGSSPVGFSVGIGPTVSLLASFFSLSLLFVSHSRGSDSLCLLGSVERAGILRPSKNDENLP